MLKKARTLLAALAAGGVMLAVLTGPAPAAASASDLKVQVRPTSKVLWAEASLPRIKAHKVEIRVLAPTGPEGRREAWQWCRVNYVGLGNYRCGVDFGPRSPLRDLDGKWEARLLVDGKLQDRRRFNPN